MKKLPDKIWRRRLLGLGSCAMSAVSGLAVGLWVEHYWSGVLLVFVLVPLVAAVFGAFVAWRVGPAGLVPMLACVIGGYQLTLPALRLICLSESDRGAMGCFWAGSAYRTGGSVEVSADMFGRACDAGHRLACVRAVSVGGISSFNRSYCSQALEFCDSFILATELLSQECSVARSRCSR